MIEYDKMWKKLQADIRGWRVTLAWYGWKDAFDEWTGVEFTEGHFWIDLFAITFSGWRL